MEIKDLDPKKVFEYFAKMSLIPRGSGNMVKIADYIESFAASHMLRCHRDSANNVVIFKPASAGYEKSPAVILQGHLDIVCQKTPDRQIDFEREGLDVYIDGEYLRARGTTLGADNGIAAAMILAILDDDSIAHPAIEAVFTTDEEIGMLGAMALDMSILSAKMLINLDSEEDDTLTVSCAGGSDLCVSVPTLREKKCGRTVSINFSGLLGGHSGIEIDKGRVNADILAGRFLSHIKKDVDFDIISINGGNKDNAIPCACEMVLLVSDFDRFEGVAKDYLELIKAEISARESGFAYEVTSGNEGEYAVFGENCKNDIIRTLLLVPNGVIDMSPSIAGLVETSLNLGILATEQDEVKLSFALRSNKQTSLEFIEERVCEFFSAFDCKVTTGGHYPPWEYRENSSLRDLYISCYTAQRGEAPKVAAIHAGLECGTFSAKIAGLDCIAMGPTMFDVHTTGERLLIPSVKMTYELLLDMLKKMK